MICDFPKERAPPLFSHVKTEAPSFALDPPWHITSVPVFALQVLKGGKLLGPSESVSTTVFQLWNLGTGVTHLKKHTTVFIGVISYHQFFLDKDEEGSLVFFGCFFARFAWIFVFLFESPICSICCILQWPHVKTRWTWRVEDGWIVIC